MLMRSSDGMCCYDRLRYRDGGYRFTSLNICTEKGEQADEPHPKIEILFFHKLVFVSPPCPPPFGI